MATITSIKFLSSRRLPLLQSPPSTRLSPFFSTTSSSSPDAPPPAPTQSQRLRALSLYRRLLRASSQMPTPNRQNYVASKTRSEYRKNLKLEEEEEIEFCLRLADTNLDTVMVQAEHLTRLFRDPEYQNYWWRAIERLFFYDAYDVLLPQLFCGIKLDEG